MSKRCPAWLAVAAEVAQLAVTALFFGLIAWRVFGWGLEKRHDGELSETLKIAFYPLAFCLSGGLWLLTLNLVIDLVAKVAGLRAGGGAR